MRHRTGRPAHKDTVFSSKRGAFPCSFPPFLRLAARFSFLSCACRARTAASPGRFPPEKEAELLQKMQQGARRGGPRAADRAQSAAGGAYRQEVLCRKRRAGRPDLDRHDRADQGGEHLPAGQKHPPGDLCLQVYSKRAASCISGRSARARSSCRCPIRLRPDGDGQRACAARCDLL